MEAWKLYRTKKASKRVEKHTAPDKKVLKHKLLGVTVDNAITIDDEDDSNNNRTCSSTNATNSSTTITASNKVNNKMPPSEIMKKLIYRQKGKKRGYLQYSTMVLLVSGSFSQRKNILKVTLKLNCTFQTSSMVSTMFKYQLSKKNINFFTPGFSHNDFISQANKNITCSPFDMTYVAPR